MRLIRTPKILATLNLNILLMGACNGTPPQAHEITWYFHGIPPSSPGPRRPFVSQ